MCSIDTLYRGWRNEDGTVTVTFGRREFSVYYARLCDWGRRSSGAVYLAGLLLELSGAVESAPTSPLTRRFCRDHVSRWDDEWAVTALEILEWVEQQP